MKNQLIASIAALMALSACSPSSDNVSGLDQRITFVGRTDTASGMPRQYGAGAYFSFGFDGSGCELDIIDENLYGTNYNYLEVIVDGGEPIRVSTHGVRNTLVIGRVQHDLPNPDSMQTVIGLKGNLEHGKHTIEVVRDTETGMGYTALSAVRTTGLTKWTRPTKRRIEFIGNSITCGAEAYLDEVPYGEGTWFDRHRAYYAYGPRTARALDAQWMLTSVSGIGLIHSCCDMTVTMPQVYDKVALSTNQISYDFSFGPDVICSCLGQNDGIQDDETFIKAYVDFIADLRSHSPKAQIVLLSSPMANEELTAWMQSILPRVKEATGDNLVSTFFFSRSWNNGGGGHPDMAEHEQIADELTAYLKTIL